MTRLLLSAVVFISGCTVVSPGTRGVRIILGKVSDEPKSPGIYLWVPFIVSMADVDTQIQKSEFITSGATKDMQDVHAEVAVNWSLLPEHIVKTYVQIGNENEVASRILRPAVAEILKASTARRTAEEVLTKRMEMKQDIDNGLRERLAQYGIVLNDLSITNLRFSDGFTQAIEHKQIAEQQAQQAAYVALKATQDAKAEVERAKGQAEAQRLMKSTITNEILQQRAIEKWNGNLPQVMSGGQVPFLNLNLMGK